MPIIPCSRVTASARYGLRPGLAGPSSSRSASSGYGGHLHQPGLLARVFLTRPRLMREPGQVLPSEGREHQTTKLATAYLSMSRAMLVR